MTIATKRRWDIVVLDPPKPTCMACRHAALFEDRSVGLGPQMDDCTHPEASQDPALVAIVNGSALDSIEECLAGSCKWYDALREDELPAYFKQPGE